MMNRWRSLPTDVIAVFVIGVVLSSITLMQIRRARSAARAVSCGDNLKQIGLATHNYHSAYKQLPIGSGGSSNGSEDEPLRGNANRLSAFVGLVPFLEQQALWEEISNPKRVGTTTFPSMGPVPWYDPDVYQPWGKRPAVLVCPDDSGAEKFKTPASYSMNYGDAVMNVGAAFINPPEPYNEPHNAGPATRRGMFIREYRLRFRDTLDGLSNTLLFSESRIGGRRVAKNVQGLIRNPSLGMKGTREFWPEGREACWADGALLSTGFQGILPPNSPSCTSPKGNLEGVMSASSYHPVGVHVLMADARVAFVRESIDVGDSTSPSVTLDGQGIARRGSRSPYGAWGAMATRASRETLDLQKILQKPLRSLSEDEIESFADRPLQRWRAANGRGEISARRMEVQESGWVILLTESGEVKNIPLSVLHPQDAYRSVEESLADQFTAKDQVLGEINDALRLLEQRKFTDFVSNHIDPAMGADSIASLFAMLPMQRGMVIAQLDATIALLNSPQAMDAIKIEGNLIKIGRRANRHSGGTYTRRSPSGELVMRRIGDRWLMVLR